MQNNNILISYNIIKRWPSKSAKKWVEYFVKTLYNNYEIQSLVAFGSVVRKADYSADIDLLYIYKDSKPNHILPPIDVDVRSYKKSEIESLIKDGHEILCWAIRYGRVIFDKENYWLSICEKWDNQLPLPSAEEALRRAEKAGALLNDIRKIGDQDAADEQLIAMLTHIARANLIKNNIFPASRPELPNQLESVGENAIASQLKEVLYKFKYLRSDINCAA